MTLARAPGPPYFLGSHLLGSATNKVLSYWRRVSTLEGNLTLNLSLFGLIDEFLIICDASLGNGLSDGVDLSNVAGSSNLDPNVQILESLETQEQDGLHNFDS